MSENTNSPAGLDLRQVAAATAVVLGMVAAAAIAWLLLDILLLLFIGIVVAAALQPWHVVLCRWGIPKGLAVLLIYLFLLVVLVLMALVVGPMLAAQVDTFIAELPQSYAGARSYLQGSTNGSLRFLAQRLPPFERLAPALADLAPQLAQGTLGVTTTIVKLPVYFASVLAIAFYWTLEVPRLERTVLTLIPVERRPRALNVWHEIESKLGGFIRGQGLAMLFIGVASTLGYALIGLPNVLALGVLAGLLEAVPLIGPLLAVAPALLVALPLGGHAVPLVVVLAVLLHLVESNVIIPRIMHRAVGVSALVSLLAILAFGTLYGILGVLIAIPMAAVIQVLLDSLLMNADPAAEPASDSGSPWDDLRAHIRPLRQQARVRLRARTSRMGIDPASADHVVDAVDQQIEAGVARVETLISLAEVAPQPARTDSPASGAGAADRATQRIRKAVKDVEELVVAAEKDERDA